MASDFIITTNAEELARRLDKMQGDLWPAMQEAGHKTGKEAVRLFRGTTRTWSHQPSFDYAVEAGGKSFDVLAGTGNQIYRYVDEGTRPHVIAGRHLLAFRANYQAKTSPGSLQARSGGASGPMVFAKRVMHPGIRARGFTPLVKKKAGTFAVEEFNRRLKKWVRRWGD